MDTQINPAIPAAPIRRWQDAHYTTIRNDSGQYTFLGTNPEALAQYREGMQTDVERIQRRMAALDAFLNGGSVQCPSALNF